MELTSLSHNQKTDCLSHLPPFELSYETISHKKVSSDYNITMAIPYGKKVMLWFTYFRDRDVCLFMELDKDKKVYAIRMLFDQHIPVKLAYGTLLYGSLCEIPDNRSMFVIEDIITCFGIPVSRQPFQEKLAFMKQLFTDYSSIFGGETSLPIMMPVCWNIIPDSDLNVIPEQYEKHIPYSIHHLQHRPLYKNIPYINVTWSKNVIPTISKTQVVPDTMLFIPPQLPQFCTNKPQYRQLTTFEIKADIQNDIYHLYAFGKNAERIYCGIAYIPNCKVSTIMNSVFRKIKENQSLDALEESDDEDNFQDSRVDKYVNLRKVHAFECSYSVKFKKWIPVRGAQGRGNIVHIRNL